MFKDPPYTQETIYNINFLNYNNRNVLQAQLTNRKAEHIIVGEIVASTTTCNVHTVTNQDTTMVTPVSNDMYAYREWYTVHTLTVD